MAKRVKGGTVAVEITLDKDQFRQDFKAEREFIRAEQFRLSMEMQRNKVKIAVDASNQNWVDRMLGNTAIGKIQAARQETQQLNTQIGLQQAKVDLARNAWASIFAVKGASSSQAITAEKSYLREQMALAKLKTELNNTSSAAGAFGAFAMTTAGQVAAAVVAMAIAYGGAVKEAVAWGQAVNDIVDETGMLDQAAARLLGVMNIVGLSTEEAAGAMAKLAKSVSAAAKEQDAAAKSGQESNDVFSRFGIAIKDSSGNMLGHEEILKNIIAVHRQMADGLEKTAMEMEIFGRGGYKLNDLLNLSEEQLRNYTDRIDKLRLSISDSQQYEDFNRELNMMSLSFKSMAVNITESSIPALTEMIKKVEEMAGWVAENKAAITEMIDTVAGIVTTMAKPFVVGMELMIEALKTYVEWRQKAIDADKAEKGETSKPPKAEPVPKNDSVAVAKAAKDKLDAEKELNIAIMQLSNQTLAVQLENIVKEEKAWATKTQNQAAAAEWAEKARAKAFEEAQQRIDAGLKSYENALQAVQSAREGIGSAFQGAYGSAVNQVKLNIQDSTKGSSASDAVQKMKDEFELQKRASREVAAAAGYNQDDINAGVFDPMSAQQQVAKAFESLNKAITDADKQKLDYLKIIAQNTAAGSTNNQKIPGNNEPQDPRYNHDGGDKVIPGQNLTITVPVSIDGQQVGQAAAKIILPPVQTAIAQAKTSYGGPKQ